MVLILYLCLAGLVVLLGIGAILWFLGIGANDEHFTAQELEGLRNVQTLQDSRKARFQ
jgi:hypothetical protein